jgi:hypothetical protein
MLRSALCASGLFVGRSSSLGEILRPDFFGIEFCCTLAHRLQYLFEGRRLAFDPAD